MRNRQSSKGAGKIGCLFGLALAAAFLFICGRIIPVYYHSSEFQSGVELEISRAGAKFLSDEVLRKSIMNLAAVHLIPLAENDLKIVRSNTQIAVDVKYRVRVDLLVYTHTIHFEFRTRSVIGAL